MSYHEKQSIVNILSGIIITTVFALIVYQKHVQGILDLTRDYSSWGVAFLIFMGVSIVARIVIYIIFHIINAIATREEDIPVTDEREKLIKLKASRNGHYAFTLSFVIAIILLAMGKPPYLMFIIFVASGLATEIVDNCSRIYYHRKGV